VLRLATAALFLLSAAVCQASTAMPLRGELPKIGTVGAVPTEDTLTVEVHADGSLTAAGLPYTYDEFAALVRERAAALPGEVLGGCETSHLNLHVRAAASLPVAAVTRIVRTCVQKDVLAPRVFFGVRHVDGAGEGAFAWFLPVDVKTPKGREPHHPDVVKVLLRADIDGDGSGLALALRKHAAGLDDARRRDTRARVDVPGDLCWQAALGALDAAASAGFGGADLVDDLTGAQLRAWTMAPTRHDLRALVAATPVVQQVGCRVGPATVFAGEAGAAPAAVDDAFAGFSEVALLEPAPPPEPKPAERLHNGARDPIDGITRFAIEDGLRWLKAHQDDDGRWDCDAFMKHDREGDVDGAGEAGHDIGVTALALLAMLADGSTTQAGPHQQSVQRAMHWLVTQQQQNGLIGKTTPHDYIYGHAIATLALAEAFANGEDDALRAPLQQAINYLESHRNPYAVWRYQPRDNDNDTAVTSWCAHAYLTARDHNLRVNKQALKLVETWLDQVADPATGHHGYTRQGQPSARLAGDHAERFPPDKNEAITATALFLRQQLGQQVGERDICRKAADLVVAKLPAWTPEAGNIDLYAWYWGSLSMHRAGGAWWQRWNKAVNEALVIGQSKQGATRGSWDPIGVWGEAGGRVYATAIATLTLLTDDRLARAAR